MLFITDQYSVASCNLTSRLVKPRRIRSGPVISPGHPWECNGVYFQGSVLKEGARFRMWYSAIGERRWDQQYTCYAESDDGVHFEKRVSPEFGVGPWPRTNIVYGSRFSNCAPGVHVCQHRSASYRFFMVFDSRIEQHQDRYVDHRYPFSSPRDRERLKRHPNYTPDFDWSRCFDTGSCRALYAADSHDGLHWEPADGRFCLAGMSDGDHAVVWDPQKGYYRMFFRDNRVDDNGHRIRQVVSATSGDTVEWTAPEVVLEPDAIDDPRVNQIHGMTVTHHDGLYVGLVHVMEICEEFVEENPLMPFERARFYVQLAVSEDGRRFTRVADRAEFFGPGEPGGWDGGMVRSGGQVVFDGDRMLFYYDGRNCRHSPGPGEPYVCGIGVAESARDRFTGLAQKDPVLPGYLVVRVPAAAKDLTLNAEVPAGGAVEFSLRWPDGCRIPSYAESDCLPVRAGGLRVPLRWRGRDALPDLPGEIHLRLALTGGAVVYALNPGGAWGDANDDAATTSADSHISSGA